MPSKSIKCKGYKKTCATLVYAGSLSGLCRSCKDVKTKEDAADRLAKAQAAKPSVMVADDREKQRREFELTNLRRKYDESLAIIERQERDLRAMNILGQGVETFRITPKKGSKTSEATVVLVGSDWHVEENVDPGQVSGLNTFNTEIAKERATRFFQGGLRLTNLLAQDVNISTMVLALLGDMISNDIHDEFPEINELQPMHAVNFAQGLLISGIEFLLQNSTLDLVIVCHSGNHARTTKTTRFSAENGHSLEYLMYLHMAAYFRTEPRIKFVIPDGMHSYMDIYETKIRFQHGHAIKYGGGVGGIYIPVNKAIGQWNKARKVDLDVFGHFHQARDGGNFICNGSLIGYNAFALSIKADYEPPKQQLFLMDKKRGRTCTWPILVGGTK